MNKKVESKRFSVEVAYDPWSGNVTSENWFNEQGERERLGDKPAQINYCPDTGEVVYQRWHTGAHGLHREGDLPAEIVTDPVTRNIVAVGYAIGGSLHREGDKPASIDWNSEGKLIEEQYWQHDAMHRDPALGPAVIKYDPRTGEVVDSEFWFEGIRLPRLSPDFGLE